MLTVLVASTKGGCGKTTVATNLAAAFANAGHRTVLADCDRQKSSLGWIRRRPFAAATVEAANWTRAIGKPPKRTARLVIDAPAAMPKKQIEALVRAADVIVVPVLPSAFDEDATRRFLGKLESLKPIRKNKRAVGLIGNRMRSRSRAADQLDSFLGAADHEVVTRLRDSLIYPELAAQGKGLADLTSTRARNFAADWRPLLDWIGPAG